MTRTILVTGLLLTLAACNQTAREMPTNESGGADETRISPCVCMQLDDYDGSGFSWKS